MSISFAVAHLQLTRQVVCNNIAQEKQLVRIPGITGHVTQCRLCFQFGEQPLLRTTPFMEFNDMFGLCCLVGYDDFVPIVEIVWFEKSSCMTPLL